MRIRNTLSLPSSLHLLQGTKAPPSDLARDERNCETKSEILKSSRNSVSLQRHEKMT